MSDDDYMSADFITQAETVQAGSSQQRGHRRYLHLESKREANERHNRTVPKKHELEKTRRDEALQKPIEHTSKGFALMAKMGFKPGMSLGKKKDEHDMGSGIKEPLPLDLKVDRKGLGAQAKEDEDRTHRLKAEMDKMLYQARNNEQLIDEYRKRKRDGSSTKQLIGDILKSRTACCDLDMRMEMRTPLKSWFWKSFPEKSITDDTRTSQRRKLYDVDEEEERPYFYVNGEPAGVEERYNELSDDILEDRIMEITAYLRSNHYYCIWCGCSYSNEEDLSQNCPGSSRQFHDDSDE